MQSGDGLLARVKPPAGLLASDVMAGMADLAERHGNGCIELTNRGNLQFRGVRAESVAAFGHTVIDLGLAEPRPGFERIRNLTASPLGPYDPAADFDSHAMARALAAALAEDPSLWNLPDKFGFAVDAGGALPLPSGNADLLLRACGDRTVSVALDGGERAVRCTLAEAVPATLRLVGAYLELAGFPATRRMRTLVADVGAATLFARAGLSATAPVAADSSARRSPVGSIESPPGLIVAVGVGAPFGRMTAAALRQLADTARRAGIPGAAPTPWRALVFPADAAQAASLAKVASGLGLIARPDDARLGISACIGMPACGAATVNTMRDATRIAAAWTGDGRVLHISGCTKGCAHPYPAAITLVGRNGRYDVVTSGRACDAPVRRDLDPAQAADFVRNAVAGTGQ